MLQCSAWCFRCMIGQTRKHIREAEFVPTNFQRVTDIVKVCWPWDRRLCHCVTVFKCGAGNVSIQDSQASNTSGLDSVNNQGWPLGRGGQFRCKDLCPLIRRWVMGSAARDGWGVWPWKFLIQHYGMMWDDRLNWRCSSRPLVEQKGTATTRLWTNACLAVFGWFWWMYVSVKCPVCCATFATRPCGTQRDLGLVQAGRARSIEPRRRHWNWFQKRVDCNCGVKKATCMLQRQNILCTARQLSIIMENTKATEGRTCAPTCSWT